MLTILDGWKVSKRDFQRELDGIKKNEGAIPIFRRSDFSLKMEWAVHNFLYCIGYQRERTKDADLDNPCDKPEWVYEVLGVLVWLWIK